MVCFYVVDHMLPFSHILHTKPLSPFSIIVSIFSDSFKTLWKKGLHAERKTLCALTVNLTITGSHLWSHPPLRESWHCCWWTAETLPILNWTTHLRSKPSCVLFLAPLSFWSEETCRKELHLPSPWQHSLWILYFLWEVLFNNSKVTFHPLTPPAPATFPKFDTLFDWFAFLLNRMPGSTLK